MDKTDTDFLETCNLQPFIWLCYIDDGKGENSLNNFEEELNQFLPNLKFTYEASKEKLDLSVTLKNG